MKQHILVMLIYDSVTNPIFESQVLLYIKNKLLSGTYQKAIIISFEKNDVQPYTNETIEIIYAPRQRFISMVSLTPCVNFVTSFLNTLEDSYELIARGPYAGYIALNSLQHLNNKPLQLIVQIRGLLTEEYVYAQTKTKNNNMINACVLHLRAYLLRRLERSVYNNRWLERYDSIRFEAVSTALISFIETTYGLRHITISEHDTLAGFDKQYVPAWRLSVRNELNIPPGAYVYCYNGSAKPWQCAEQTLEYYAQQQHPDRWLLIISAEATCFNNLLKLKYAHLNNVIVQRVAPDHVYRFLAACDEGIIFREPHILNWVSRPTKVLEYQAVGLTITHNNTVGMLSEQKTSNQR